MPMNREDEETKRLKLELSERQENAEKITTSFKRPHDANTTPEEETMRRRSKRNRNKKNNQKEGEGMSDYQFYQLLAKGKYEGEKKE